MRLAVPTVSVVVPTVGRVELVAALRSAHAQEFAPCQIVVVDDSPTRMVGDEVGPGVLVVRTGGGEGPAAARMLGVAHATGELIAFLDDDDEWLPDKLQLQVAQWSVDAAAGLEAVVGCRIEVVDEHGHRRAVVPETTFAPGASLVGWVFRRTSIRPAGFALGSSTLLCSKVLLQALPFDVGLRLHEDWDWVLRASRRPGVVVRVLDRPLVRYRDTARGPAASRPSDGWRQSLAWVDRSELPPRERGDLLVGVTAGLALREGLRLRALRLVGHAVRSARPGLPAIMGFGLQLLLPAQMLRALASRVGQIRARHE